MYKEILKSMLWGFSLLFILAVLCINLLFLNIFYEKFLPNTLVSNAVNTSSIIKPKIDSLIQSSEEIDWSKAPKSSKEEIINDVKKYCEKCIVPYASYPYSYYDFQDLFESLERNKVQSNIDLYNRINTIALFALLINSLLLIYFFIYIIMHRNSTRSYVSMFFLGIPLLSLTYSISFFEVNTYFDFKISDNSSYLMMFTLFYLFVIIPALFTFLKKSEINIYKLILLNRTPTLD